MNDQNVSSQPSRNSTVLTGLLSILLFILIIVRMTAKGAFNPAGFIGMLLGSALAVVIIKWIAGYCLGQKGMGGRNGSLASWNIAIAVTIFLHLSSWIFLAAQEKNVLPTPESIPVSAGIPLQITNPEYAANPAAYLVDREDKVKSPIPTGRAVWVEDIVDERTLRVSFPVEQAGTQIMELENLAISGLGYPSGTTALHLWKSSAEGQCWRYGAISFLQTNLLHKPVYLVVEKPPHASEGPFAPLAWGYRVLMDAQNSAEMHDVAEFVIWKGYGGTRYDRPRAEEAYNRHPAVFTTLKEAEEVASLADRGLWAACKQA